MTEAAFLRELEIFRDEVQGATQLFYAHLAVHATMAQHKEVADRLNDSVMFWNACLYALQCSTFIVLGRIFDQDPRSKHNIDRLISFVQKEPHIFSKSALASRRHGSTSRNLYEPTVADFRRLRAHIKKWRRVYENNYRPIRREIFAHRGLVEAKESEALWARTQIRRMQLLLRFLRQLHEALWELFHNGWKPVLRSQRYSVVNMRRRPSASGRVDDVAEGTIFETEAFLRLASGLPPPTKPKKRGGIFDLYDEAD